MSLSQTFSRTEAAESSEELAKRAFRPRRADSRKGENGVVAVVGGSAIFHGAPLLAALAAQKAGVDLVFLAVPKLIATAVRAYSPTLIVFPTPDAKLTKGSVNKLLKWMPDFNALVVGPGLGRQRADGLTHLIRESIQNNVKIVLDADALVSEAVSTLRGSLSVITPHAGEFKRIYGEDPGASLEERIRSVRAKARESGTVILLKGPIDVISDGEDSVINRTGSPAMTVGGTGDVLCGLVGGLLALGASPFDAAVAGAYVNGLAGERAAAKLGFHITATDVVDELVPVLKKFDSVEF